MKAYYFREFQSEKFLVPEEHIKGFDSLDKKMESVKLGSDKEYKLSNEFNEKYWQYKCEGELYNTKLFLLDKDYSLMIQNAKDKENEKSKLQTKKVYEALYNPMTWESGYVTISIHLSKEGAEKAIADHKMQQQKEWEILYNDDDDEKPYEFGKFEDWFVREVEVLL